VVLKVHAQDLVQGQTVDHGETHKLRVEAKSFYMLDLWFSGIVLRSSCRPQKLLTVCRHHRDRN
jgi:hypothetical protein